MKTCICCHTELLDIASFCHNCGKEVQGNAIICLKCETANPKKAKFCFNCGHPINLQYVPKPNVSPVFKLDFNDIPSLPIQLKEAFLNYISWVLTEEGNSDHEARYIQAFEERKFRLEVFEEQAIQLASQLEEGFISQGASAFSSLESLIQQRFLDWIEIFWINYCPELSPFPLSENILAYQNQTIQDINWPQMIRDYLQLEEENFLYYQQAIDIPIKKMKTARKSYFKHNSGEFPYLLIDQTVFGSAKEGLVLSKNAIYWKAHFHKAEVVPYHKIKTLSYRKNQLQINSAYLNITASFNYKLFKLLSRIRAWNS